MVHKQFMHILCMLSVLSMGNVQTRDRSVTRPMLKLILDMRKLWEDHIVYTRNFIISAIADLGDKEAVTNRLLENQDDIGNAIKPYYGPVAATELSKLLRE